MKVLTWFMGRKHRAEIIDIERQLNELVEIVDQFYELLGDRNWVFHDQLNLERIKVALTFNPTSESLELELISIYQAPGSLDLMIRQLNDLPEIGIRQHLIQLALNDYRAKRYAATTLMLLTIMDGFVNDIETKRTGLHARSPDDLVAWDSVVGHHKGLSHAHNSFIWSTGKTISEETFELRRHGILHGTILNYDNVIVATKAWNRLFAVTDWARSMRRQSQPVEPTPSLRELSQRAVNLTRDKQVLAEWKPYSLSSSDERFYRAPLLTAVREFLEAWQRHNYGRMSHYIPDRPFLNMLAAKPARVREAFEFYQLKDYSIELLDFVAPAVCEVDASLEFEDGPQKAQLRWIREKLKSNDPAITEDEGVWHLYIWSPHAMFSRRNKSHLGGSSDDGD